jgi:hypothetical protein
VGIVDNAVVVGTGNFAAVELAAGIVAAGVAAADFGEKDLIESAADSGNYEKRLADTGMATAGIEKVIVLPGYCTHSGFHPTIAVEMDYFESLYLSELHIAGVAGAGVWSVVA